MKQRVLDSLTHPALKPLWRPFLRGANAVFMLHRFADPERGWVDHAHEPNELRSFLGYLRAEGHSIVSLRAVLDAFEHDDPLQGAIAFTVDDGYADFLHVALPVFAEFDIPVTIFATTGFIDRDCWFWWDQIHCALRETDRRMVSVDVPGSSLTYRLDEARDRHRAAWDLIERLKAIPESEARRVVATLATSLEVTLPAIAPEWCTPMTWSELRACTARGVDIGPHTVTHPILSRVDPERAAEEITGSWQRLRSEIPDALPVFCYPNGDPGSFGVRETTLVRQLGLRAAMSTYQEYVTSRFFHEDIDAALLRDRFALPRFVLPATHAHLVQVVSGLERAKETLRRLLPR
jgi:peptidoglycan/xylan/chitin deacetylase (PgdA/CDA1 family)